MHSLTCIHFTCIHIYPSILWFKTKNAKIVQMNLYIQVDMIFCMIIYWTCDMHLGLQILKSHEYKQSTKWTNIYRLFGIYYLTCSDLWTIIGHRHPFCIAIPIYIKGLINNLSFSFGQFFLRKRIQCNSYKGFLWKKWTWVVKFFFWLKLPYLDNRFHKVAKIWEDC